MSMLSENELLKLTKEIIVAHVSHNTVDSGTLPDLIRSVHLSLVEARGAGRPDDSPVQPIAADTEAAAVAALQPRSNTIPAVPVDESVTPDYIICLEDGRRFKMMKRWLRATYGMTPDQYRAKWGLPADYPMVAPAYARSKSDYAKHQGLGTDRLRQQPTRQVALG